MEYFRKGALMKKITTIFCAVLFVSGICCAAGNSIPTKEEAKQIFDQVMQALVKDDVEGAFALIDPYFPLNPTEISTLKVQIIQQRGLIRPRFGKSLGFDFLTEKNLKDIYAQFIYIERFEHHMIRWIFAVYKPKDQWVINSIFFDDKIQDLIQ